MQEWQEKIEQEVGQLREAVKRIERETEPMRLERRLSIPEANTLQTIMEMVGRQGPDIATLKGDVSVLKQTTATKSQLDELRQAMEKRFDSIAEVQKLILARLPKPPEEEK